MEHEFSGKAVLITGAGGGIGAAVARAFAAAGARLLLADLALPSLEDIARDIRAGGAAAEIASGDVSSPGVAEVWVKAAMQAFGRLDVAVNAAGIIHPFGKTATLDLESFERVMRVNVTGLFLSLKAQIPALRDSGGGAIVNLASVAGLGGAPGLGAYAASKHAVIGLTRTAAIEYVRDHIRINALCPSYVETPMAAATMPEAGSELRDQRLTGFTPMKRYATVKEVADAVLWLASPRNSFMTGQAVAVDGGLTAI